jgi:hypothetical protein
MNRLLFPLAAQFRWRLDHYQLPDRNNYLLSSYNFNHCKEAGLLPAI